MHVPLARCRVDLNRDSDLAYWLEELSCSRRELIDAVNAVGTEPALVRAHLQRKRLRSALSRIARVAPAGDERGSFDAPNRD